MQSGLRFSVVAPCLFLLAGFPAGLSRAVAGEFEEFVDSVANTIVASGGVVGMSIGVARGDEILLAKGYGYANLEHAVPATGKTVYRIGSITKQFTAAAILLLAEEGEIAFDDPLTKFLPDYPAQGHTVTVRHLLDHTSGIRSVTAMPEFRLEKRQDATHDEILATFKDVPFDFAPGEKFKYNNSGYYLLGVILENVTGETYAGFLQNRVFDPLALKDTCYDSHARIIPGRSSGYARAAGKKEFFNAEYLSMTRPFAAGSLASTVEDLIAWQRGLLKNRILTADSYTLMTTPGELNDGKPTNYGCGVFLQKLDGHPVIRHGGGINGFRSELAYLPESDETIVVLTNTEGAQPNRLADRIARYLFELAGRPSD